MLIRARGMGSLVTARTTTPAMLAFGGVGPCSANRRAIVGGNVILLLPEHYDEKEPCRKPSAISRTAAVVSFLNRFESKQSVVVSLTLLLLSLMQSPSWIIGPASAPPCRDVSLSIEAMQPLHANFQFRATIRNRSSVPFVLAAPIRVQWDLAFMTPQGWKLVVGGGVLIDTDMMDIMSNWSKGKDVVIMPGEVYEKTLKRPDVGGEDHLLRAGRYRVTFTLTHELSIEEASFGNRICPLRANPVVFREM